MSCVKILINPGDMDEVRRLLPELSKTAMGGEFQLIEDTAVGQGGCIMQTGFGEINATIEDQCVALEKEIERELQSGNRDGCETIS